MNKKVAFIQNRIQPGGRLHVMLHAIGVLNEMGIRPDVITLKSRIQPAEIAASYGIDADFSFVEIFHDFRLPFEWHILFFNWLTRFYLHEYDLVINSNNTSFLTQSSLNSINYVHFPRKARLRPLSEGSGRPQDCRSPFLDVRGDFLRLAGFLYRYDGLRRPGELIVANSRFTKQHILAQYPVSPDEVRVIYPPVEAPQAVGQRKVPDSIASLGRFAPDKRQLEQIRIMKELPNCTLNVIGFVGDRAYFQECQEYVRAHGLRNVRLSPDADARQMNESLRTAEFFIHSLRDEPFGITTVQAINSGCIPIAHDSGGQREIVPIDELRYRTLDEAVEILLRLSTLGDDKKNRYREILAGVARRFRPEQFRTAFRDVVMSKLPLD